MGFLRIYMALSYLASVLDMEHPILEKPPVMQRSTQLWLKVLYIDLWTPRFRRQLYRKVPQ